jgi:heme/copper-type cytochrome/quinol oxidase subunit 2
MRQHPIEPIDMTLQLTAAMLPIAVMIPVAVSIMVAMLAPVIIIVILTMLVSVVRERRQGAAHQKTNAQCND